MFEFEFEFESLSVSQFEFVCLFIITLSVTINGWFNITTHVCIFEMGVGLFFQLIIIIIIIVKAYIARYPGSEPGTPRFT